MQRRGADCVTIPTIFQPAEHWQQVLLVKNKIRADLGLFVLFAFLISMDRRNYRLDENSY